MSSDFVIRRAQEFTETLREMVPILEFRAYVPREATSYVTDLYLLGFITQEVPMGGYCIPAEEIEQDSEYLILNISQFFRKIWQREEPQFFPAELREWYEAHRATGTLWWRIA